MCKDPQSQCTGCPKSSCVIVAIWNGKLSIRLFLAGITCGVQSDYEIMTGGFSDQITFQDADVGSGLNVLKTELK